MVGGGEWRSNYNNPLSKRFYGIYEERLRGCEWNGKKNTEIIGKEVYK